jgi:glycosyltransferase involved in cell wall biosynthesis
LRQRYDQGLVDANVLHCSAASALFESQLFFAKNRNTWDFTISRNKWFQSRASKRLRALGRAVHDSGRVVFAYSYAAREVMQAARELGCTTILGQIDPGPAEEKIVAEACLRNGNPSASLRRAPDSYWEDWREECDLCDRIVVNSPWSRRGLIGEGVPREKIDIVPVAYDAPDEARRFRRFYPTSFNATRPLRVLFLGSLIPRKGIYEMLEATNLLRTGAVEFRFVGPPGVQSPLRLVEDASVRWMGPVDRQGVHEHYRNADIFILPTHSDGFGQTQLEAMAWGLPVIASKNCGQVVDHKFNGLILPRVAPDAIADAIEWCLMNTEALARMSQFASRTCNKFRSDRMVWELLLCAGRTLGP